MIIIGIDPGKRRTGAAVIVDGKLRYVTSGPVDSAESLRVLVRRVYRDAANVERDATVAPVFERTIVTEEQHVSPKTGRAGLDTAAARGMVVGGLAVLLPTANIRVLRPSEWRCMLLGPGCPQTGNAAKAVVYDWVMAHEPHVTRWLPDRRRKLNYDETDAIGIARAYERSMEGSHD